METHSNNAVLLINLGSPASTSVKDVRKFLRQFLMDPRIIDIAAPSRWFLVNCIIAPFRAKRSARAYKRIWSANGSPLIKFTSLLKKKVQAGISSHTVAMAMRYGEPSMRTVLNALLNKNPESLVIVPLFPQYAEATVGSVIAEAEDIIAAHSAKPEISVVRPFYDDDGFIGSLAGVVTPIIAACPADHILFSYHGLPERQIRKANIKGSHCLVKKECCARMVIENQNCYRAQCFATTRALMRKLNLDEKICTTSFQSRMGRTKWIGPHTEEEIVRLAQQGTERLLVVCPSFVADCLETLEEIGIRAKELFLESGGTSFELAPCLNDSDAWASALSTLILRA